MAELGDLPLPELLAQHSPLEPEYEFAHRRTYPVGPERGQGDAHIAFVFAAHRAVVDVDTELGLVKVMELATAQDVGKAMNPHLQPHRDVFVVDGLPGSPLDPSSAPDGTTSRVALDATRNPDFHGVRIRLEPERLASAQWFLDTPPPPSA
ncbi:molybdopterin-dependent oxidoreductase [Streptomyces sp. G44]|nr:molybdopterin-dependent oxidoreductase [Streptomyces sp. G44]